MGREWGVMRLWRLCVVSILSVMISKVRWRGVMALMGALCVRCCSIFLSSGVRCVEVRDTSVGELIPI